MTTSNKMIWIPIAIVFILTLVFFIVVNKTIRQDQVDEYISDSKPWLMNSVDFEDHVSYQKILDRNKTIHWEINSSNRGDATKHSEVKSSKRRDAFHGFGQFVNATIDLSDEGVLHVSIFEETEADKAVSEKKVKVDAETLSRMSAVKLTLTKNNCKVYLQKEIDDPYPLMVFDFNYR